MARPIGKLHQDDVRKKIQASQIVNRLMGHINGEHELSATQVNAANILLRKTLPDLSAVVLSGDEDNPVSVVTRVELVPLGNGTDSASA